MKKDQENQKILIEEEHKSTQKKIEQVNKLLEERSKEALELAKKELLEEEFESKEIKDALTYYSQSWRDVLHPGLLSIACDAVGGDVKKSVPIQVVMLLLTAAADIHDDIIDGSLLKQGRPTVLAKYGKEAALLVGDALLVKALVLLHGLEGKFPTQSLNAIWEVIKRRFFEMGDAEALETSVKGNIDISVEKYLTILEMKAATTDAQMRIGAILGGGEQTVIDALGDYGRALGVLIGIREDFVDVFEPVELQNRIKNECLPLPVLVAFKDPHTRERVLNHLSMQQISDENAETIVDLVFQERNVEILRNRINGFVQQAMKKVSQIPNKHLVSLLERLVAGVVEDL